MVPTWLLKSTRGLLQGADWAKDAADRLVSFRVIWHHRSEQHSADRLGYSMGVFMVQT
jgi:hypothetical protein